MSVRNLFFGIKSKVSEEAHETSNGTHFSVSHPHREQPGERRISLEHIPGKNGEEEELGREERLESSDSVGIRGVLSMTERCKQDHLQVQTPSLYM